LKFQPSFYWNFSEPIRNVMPVRFRVLIDGEATETLKEVRIARGRGVDERATAMLLVAREYTPQTSLYDRTWLSRPSWMVVVEDLEAEPAIHYGTFLNIQAAGTYTINIWTGSGGAGGDPAAVTGYVRVEGVPASREVVA